VPQSGNWEHPVRWVRPEEATGVLPNPTPPPQAAPKPTAASALSSEPLTKKEALQWTIEFAPAIFKHERLRLAVMEDLAVVPAKHLKNLTVDYDPKMALEDVGEWGPSLAAYYPPGKIIFHSNTPQYGAFAHEVGHHVAILNEEDTSFRRRVHNSYLEAFNTGKGFPSEYSKVDTNFSLSVTQYI
jgi:hypothetical protein